MKTDAAIKFIQKWSLDYIKMECSGEKCYGVLAVCIFFKGSFLIIGVDNSIARFIESALRSPYSTSSLALPCLVFEILGISGLLSRMGEDCLSSNSSHFVNIFQVVGTQGTPLVCPRRYLLYHSKRILYVLGQLRVPHWCNDIHPPWFSPLG